MSNRLANETSPYLLQHAHNPVDWYPWGEEALARARAELKPIFLSIGYSACHWCHVMERESFEDREIADYLNEHFVCIKVDREERPELDQIYMQAVQMMTGHGGWPMSVFLTPELQPFFGGTYWPPTDRMGMPGFARVLRAVSDAWQNRRGQAFQQAAELTAALAAGATQGSDDTALEIDILHQAAAQLHRQFDFQNGGFGQAPKFPHAICLQFLLRHWSRTGNADSLAIVRRNLEMMARGGIYDHLAGGFARYSVDAHWLVPHFEKMLYDNSLLTDAYLDAYLVTGQTEWQTVVRETLDYVLRDMTDDNGGFHSTEDADSEGEEGKFYVWSAAEIRQLLGDALAEKFCFVYDVTEGGNFDGHNILNLRRSIAESAALKGWDGEQLLTELRAARATLRGARDRRVRPAKDDKILANWNGLMIHAMARAGAALGESRYVDGAVRAAEFVWDQMRRDDGRLLHSFRHGRARFPAYLDDYAFLAQALVALYEATFEAKWLERAVGLAESIVHLFTDPDQGGFFFTAADHEPLIARMKDLQDSSVPSGNGMCAAVLMRLGKLSGRLDFVELAGQALQASAPIMANYPIAAGQALVALDWWLGPTHEIAVVAANPEDLARVANSWRRRYWPRSVLAGRVVSIADETAHVSAPLQAMLASKLPLRGQPTLYVCRDFACEQPAIGDDEIDRQINRLSTKR